MSAAATPTVTGPGATLTLTGKSGTQTVDLYSDDGLKLVSDLWLKLSAEYKIMYEPTWLGRRIIQLPHDIVQMQELIWTVQPDLIVETGVAHGGSLILSASVLELIGKGRILGVDIDIRPHNRSGIEEHPLAHRIDLLQGSSIDPAIVAEVTERAQRAGTVMVVLDSNHSAAHVAAEIAAYAPLVDEGSYLVVMDGAQGKVFDIPRGNTNWREDNPLTALDAFVAGTDEFVVDDHFTRLHVTSNPRGYLRRIKAAAGKAKRAA
ncbi:MAG: CmcI family methyltransferase [Alphaproteobacteria bacterium]